MRGSQSHGCRPLTTSSAQVLSKHQLVMMHFILLCMVQYHIAGEEALVVVSRSHMEKP